MIATAWRVTTTTYNDDCDDDGNGDCDGAMGSGDEGDGRWWAATMTMATQRATAWRNTTTTTMATDHDDDDDDEVDGDTCGDKKNTEY
jgi:hypothetical protein